MTAIMYHLTLEHFMFDCTSSFDIKCFDTMRGAHRVADSPANMWNHVESSNTELQNMSWSSVENARSRIAYRGNVELTMDVHTSD